LLRVQSEVLVVVGTGEADVGAHLVCLRCGAARLSCASAMGGAAAAGDRWGRAMASRAGAAALPSLLSLTLAINGVHLLLCRTPCAARGVLFVARSLRAAR